MKITLIHPPSGARKVVPVEHIAANGKVLYIRWEMAGVYDLNLDTNKLTARAALRQPKGKAKWYRKGPPEWQAEDIAAVRHMVKRWLEPGAEEERKKMLAKHLESMPKVQSAD